MGVNSDRRDLNGRPVRPRRWDRLRARLGGAADGAALDPAAGGLVVVAESSDDAAASSAVLDSSSWRPDDEVVLRHLLVLPEDRAAAAIATAGLDEYVLLDLPDDDVWTRRADGPAAGMRPVVLARVQLLDAMHLSQERSRMASLGSRHGGSSVGWQVLQRPV